MSSRDFACERLAKLFQEASCKIKKSQVLFLNRAITFQNCLTSGLEWLVYRSCKGKVY